MTNSTAFILLILASLIGGFIGFNVGKSEGEANAYKQGKEEGYNTGYSEAKKEMKQEHFKIVMGLTPYSLRTYQTSLTFKSTFPFPED